MIATTKTKRNETKQNKTQKQHNTTNHGTARTPLDQHHCHHPSMSFYELVIKYLSEAAGFP